MAAGNQDERPQEHVTQVKPSLTGLSIGSLNTGSAWVTRHFELDGTVRVVNGHSSSWKQAYLAEPLARTPGVETIVRVGRFVTQPDQVNLSGHFMNFAFGIAPEPICKLAGYAGKYRGTLDWHAETGRLYSGDRKTTTDVSPASPEDEIVLRFLDGRFSIEVRNSLEAALEIVLEGFPKPNETESAVTLGTFSPEIQNPLHFTFALFDSGASLTVLSKELVVHPTN